MVRALRVSHVSFTAASEKDVAQGMLGWIALTVDGCLRIDGLALRRTADGRATISYPTRRSKAGYEHFVVRPVSDSARLHVERSVFVALGFLEPEP